MQFSASRGAGRKQRLEQLHVGRDDQWCIPVFAGQAAARRVVTFVAFGLAVVFDHGIRAEDLAKHVGRLLDDAGVGNGVDHPLLAVVNGMIQSKGQRRQSLATARGNGQPEDTGRCCGLVAAQAQHLCAGLHHRVFASPAGGNGGRLSSQMHVELLLVLIEWPIGLPLGAALGVHEGLGVEEVGVHQGGKQHAHPKRPCQRVAVAHAGDCVAGRT